ncbi:TIGR03560 family F420-dependent LLM class oxidoreductase [Pseudonocardia endophytica]|uniref:F420-dependent oxidoreductase-like protein n=1 Tax=Pseudonocardia endophytica TaxID=401976 RepID=A0A4R1HU08_PSEEN|nr:TIGR03560 family F420-dependent LLM class oxidoreductase [Pseudonocardia endophytica]TCK24405.1 F420-dependent oxidoreductase-like protein [Pseudonocardia endophytica]
MSVSTDDPVRLPSPCLVVLVGPGASGKSTWAAAAVPPDQVVSSDRLRALVGAGDDDMAASEDAFAVLDDVVRRRLARGLTTVVDTLGLDAGRRRGWLAAAREHGTAAVVVAFDVPAAECRARNRGREHPIPAAVLSRQLSGWPAVRAALDDEGWDRVLTPRPARVVPDAFAGAGEAVARQRSDPTRLRIGLHVSRFDLGRDTTGPRLRQIASHAEAVGVDAIWVMDHFRQIPQVGRAWEDMLESWTTLAHLAACTERVELGTLVTGVTYRNVAHLAKIVATLDVLSGGRARCGIGLGWFRAEHDAYGWEFPTVAQRYRLLEDACELLPRMWGPGGKPYQGRVLAVPDTSCYPRPLQERVPLLVGGGGERRTLRLAARHADAANVTGDLATARRKASVLREHCAAEGRDPADVTLTHLHTALVGNDGPDLDERVRRLRPRNSDPARFAAQVNAGTVDDHIGRLRELADAGVGEVMIALPDVGDPDALDRLGRVVAAFR